MKGMFVGATSFNQPLNNWNLFYRAISLNQPLKTWNVQDLEDEDGDHDSDFYGTDDSDYDSDRSDDYWED